MLSVVSAADDVLRILASRGDGLYGGERISQRAHALQAARLAEREGAASALVTAALLHDIGHLVHKLGDDAADRGIDDRHESLGSKQLAKWFGEDVWVPVRLHVQAKRYLCSCEAGYFAGLSDASVQSLLLQGGPMTHDEMRVFRSRPFAEDAIRLRRWDEAAKVPGLATPGLAHFRPVVERCLLIK
ncbi:MAG: HD domain-containing protein [Rhodospirillales bacterium]